MSNRVDLLQTRERTVSRMYDIVAWVLFGLMLASAVVLSQNAITAEQRGQENRAENLALLFKYSLEHRFESAATYVDVAGSDYLRNAQDLPGLRRRLASISDRDPFVHQISVVDTSGKFRVSDLSEGPPVDLTDREHIRFHLEHQDNVFFVSRPLIGRVSKQASINVSKKFYTDAGTWAGIVVISYELQKIVELVDTMSKGAGAVVSLLRNDGMLLARTGRGPQIGEVFSGAAVIKALRQGRTEGVIAARSAIDGQDRIGAFQYVRTPGVAVYVGFAGLDEYAQRVRLLAAAALIAATATLIGARGSIIMRLNMAAEREQQRISENVTRAMQAGFEHSQLLICGVQNCTLKFANTAAQNLVDKAPKDVDVTSWLLGTPADDNAAQRSRSIELADGERRSVIWVYTAADWLAPGAHVAFGLDWTDIERRQHQIFHEARLLSLGEFAAALVHEIGQAMTVVGFSVARIEACPALADDMRDDITGLRRAFDRVRAIVMRIKSFARSDDQGQGTPLPFRESVQAAVAMLKHDLAISEVDLQVSIDVPADVMCTDGVLVEQVITNLVLNARDAHIEHKVPGQPMEVRVEAGVRSDCMFVRVIDNGPGIPPVARDRIFDAFYTTKRTGLGLGLAISGMIASEMGGSLTLLPSVRGAAFELKLPL